MAKNRKLTIGVDFGTDSVRTLLVDALNGETLSVGSSNYELWAKGKYCNPNKSQFRQHPIDHINSLKKSMSELLKDIPESTINSVYGLSIASTGSTPVAVDVNGVPLALLEDFKDNPNAMFILWKDHSAIKEALEINELAHSGDFNDYTKYVGGTYSSEWFWSKILHVLRVDEKVRNAAYSWVEHSDWIPALLTGNDDPLKIKRNVCSAGHKAMWNKSWGGLPSDEFLLTVDPLLQGLRERLYTKTYTADMEAGYITGEWAKELGLPKHTKVGVGSLDAHMGAVGAQIKPNYLVKVIGTSTCDMLTISKVEIKKKVVEGICGQVDGSILPDMIGLEAGQSAFGDIYAWLKKLLMWNLEGPNSFSKPRSKELWEGAISQYNKTILEDLSNAASQLTISDSDIVALDWLNGRRTPDSNQSLKGGILGLTLGSDPPKIFKALVESTCFGSRKILERFLEESIEIKGVIAVGGVAQKSNFVMQTLADILNYPVSVMRSNNTCALGAAMSAAVVSGIYQDYYMAQKAMGRGIKKTFQPNKQNVEVYNKLYEKYLSFAEYVEKDTIQ
ncbi:MULTISPECIES: ribulokinase [Maribacter]|uniref:Ribulokinase n=2 Tax=Maribacter TaxID=252356 RepID=A0A5R8MC56_9FLAO|nr:MULTISPECIES: ribulokinase [Maribacter]KAA2219891.1 ribulokinase [Maribacter flavus]TLF47097.1 ribulokinase [Maribacter aurantiacus]